MAENKMFCFQCQETAKGTGCTIQGVCGKKADTSRWQDLLLSVVRGIGTIADSLRQAGVKTGQEVGDYIVDSLFVTITNANFDDQAILNKVDKGVQIKRELLDLAVKNNVSLPDYQEVKWGGEKSDYEAEGNRESILRNEHEDLRSLKELPGLGLKGMAAYYEQTEGTGIAVYTHSEMLPAHYYPELKKYKHLVGNYGNAWWKQKEEFETFNGPIVFTTNCIVPPTPKASYKDRVFTTNASGFPGWKHIEADKNGHKDFSEVIELAKTCKAPTAIEQGEIVGGFAHAQVFALADKVVEAVKSGAIRKFIVMSGCDGRMKSRDYYTEFAAQLPKDTVILTSGCAKYKYNKLNLGDINGIPRVLDAGQCNDSYSWAVVALKLKEIFGANDINDLPIEFNIAWYEQKAVIVLLALLSLGIKNIHIGPTLPGFVSPNVLKVLIDNFGLGTITTVEEDLKTMVG